MPQADASALDVTNARAAQTPLALPPTAWELVAQRAALTPDAPMLRDEAGRRLRFAEVRDAAELTAAGLAERGVGPGSRVSWQLPTGLEAVVLMLALGRLGAVQNPIVPILRQREVRFMAKQTAAELLVVPGVRPAFDFSGMARELAAELACDVLVLDELREPNRFGLRLPAGETSKLPPPPGSPSESPVRWIYFTSGTTADPKGARHGDASLLASSNAFANSGWFHADDVVVVPIPIAHVGGMMLTALQLRVGFEVALVESFDALRTPRFAAEVGVSVIAGTVAVFHAYLAAQRAHGPARLFPRLRIASNGGAARPLEIHDAVREALGGAGTMSGWGLSEFPVATAGRTDDTHDQLALTEGRPAPGVEVSVVGADGRDCPPGAEGELRLRGPQLFHGYVDASLDSAAFDERGRFRSGDLGLRQASGHVRITGRLKDVVLRNGENISALEVEQALASHPAIQDVAVIALPDPRTGERCCAVVQRSAAGGPITLTDLVAHCAALGLAKQKAPEQLECIDAIPRSTLGKIDKRALRERFSASPRT